MYPVPIVRFLGIFRERENWSLCSIGRSVYHKGVFRLMTRGGDSLQAFMHHVPFTAKHVRERSHWEFQEYLQSISITFASSLFASSTDAHRLKDGGKQKQARMLGRGGLRSQSLTEWLHTWANSLATALLAGCHSTHHTAHHHPAAALLVISHRDKPYALPSQHPSSTNQLPRFQNCRCLSAIA